MKNGMTTGIECSGCGKSLRPDECQSVHTYDKVAKEMKRIGGVWCLRCASDPKRKQHDGNRNLPPLR